MKRSIHVRFFISLLLIFAMLSPVAAAGFDGGKKYFKRGMDHEVAEEWDKAVEEFALAVSASPKNPEYRLHLTRALFNASQMYVKKGTLAAKEGNYEDAYVAFRRAYAFDPTNELAKSEMERMVRLQKELTGAAADKNTDPNKVKMIPTGYTDAKGAAPQMPQLPQKLERLRDLPFPSGVDLQFIIKELAKDLDLNVLFDSVSFRAAGRKTFIDLKNVTAARALDYIFLQEGLFFQKVGPRTILIATQEQRQKFQQLVLRTFYLANASPKDVAKIVQTAIPAQPGRSQTIVLTDDATNSITIRDTQENIQLIGKLISSLDKDRAEVVMDVSIYEINKSSLLQVGNQVGTVGELNNIGGSTSAVVGVGGNNLYGTIGRAAADIIPSVFGVGFVIPSSNLSLFQSTGSTKLIAQTQIHAFNNEDSSARIGQRVPVQSAQFVTGNTGVGGGGVVSNVVNYEQTGLTFKFKPLVFPNQDVQVAMEIESKDVAAGSARTDQNENPTFIERTVKGTARIQNNKTLLIASVASGTDRTVRSGLPWVSQIPILGRLFTSPIDNSSKIDIVIAVTPRVIRAPAILPEDEVERPTGSLAVPTNNSLEAMIIEEEREEQLASARKISNSPVVQLPDVPVDNPTYVRNDNAKGVDATPATANQTTALVTTPSGNLNLKPIDASNVKSIDNSVKTLQLNQTSDTSKPEQMDPNATATAVPAEKTEPSAEPKPVTAAPNVQIRFGMDIPEMKVGEKIKIPVVLQASSMFRSGVIGLKFDDKKVAVRSVGYGDVFGTTLTSTMAAPFLNQNGKMYVSLSGKDDTGAKTDGVLAFIEIEALTNGKPKIQFDRDVLNFLTTDGRSFVVSYEK